MSFPTYPAYKDSGVEWLGSVPEHWAIFSLKRSVDGCTNGLWGDEPDGENDLAVIRVADFDRATCRVGLDKLTYRSITQKERASRLLQPGDLLIEKSGGGEKTLVGCVVLFEHEFEAITSNFVARMRPLASFDSGFLCYAFDSLYQGKVNFPAIKQTTGIQNLDSESYLQEQFCFPTLVEQTQIARFLDHETARIDALIEEQQRLIELLNEKRQAVISHAVTKGLDPAVPVKDSGAEWLGEVPAHWTVTRLRRICIEINDINHVMPVAVETGVPFLSAKDLLDDGTLNFTEDVKMISESDFMALSKKICPRRGDIIYSRIGACLGKARLVETDERFLVSYSCCVVRVIEHIACPRFIQHLLDGEMILTEARLRTQGIGVPDLGLGEIGRFPIALPPVSEQKQIARYLDDQAGKFRTLTAEAKRATNLLQEHRSALISAAVTGKIDVRGWQSPVSTQVPKFEVAEAV